MLFGSQSSAVMSGVKASAPPKAAAEVLKHQAWYELKPYDGNDPDYANLDDKDRPRVVAPIPKMLVDKAAGLLFGKPCSMTADDDPLQEFVNQVWKQNSLSAKLLGWARVNGYAGAGWVKFVHNPTEGARNPWPLQYYHRGYVDAVYSDAFPDELEKLRITYREKGADGKETWFREEWTADLYREWRGLPVTSGQVPKFDEIPPTIEKPHSYSGIPAVNWPNIYDPELDPGSGRGDLDGLTSLFHRINIAADGNDLGLQLDAKGSWLAFGIDQEKAIDLTPGSVNIADDAQAFIKSVDSGDPHLEEARAFIKMIEGWIYNTARIVYLDPKEIHLGQLSSLAIRLIFGPSIELTEEKRRLAGDALEELFEKIATAAKRMGKAEGLPAEPELEVSWQELFQPTQDEIAQIQTNLQQAEQAGWLTAQETRQKAAQLHGIRHTKQRDTELDQAKEERLKEALNAAQQGGSMEADSGDDPGPADRGRGQGGR